MRSRLFGRLFAGGPHRGPSHECGLRRDGIRIQVQTTADPNATFCTANAQACAFQWRIALTHRWMKPVVAPARREAPSQTISPKFREPPSEFVLA
jgi:hypothetical protein